MRNGPNLSTPKNVEKKGSLTASPNHGLRGNREKRGQEVHGFGLAQLKHLLVTESSASLFSSFMHI